MRSFLSCLARVFFEVIVAETFHFLAEVLTVALVEVSLLPRVLPFGERVLS